MQTTLQKSRLTTLQRSKFTPREIEVLDNRALLNEAVELLEYRPAALVDETKMLEFRQHDIAVADALAQLGIDPLDPDAVEFYKAKKVRAAIKHQSSRFVKYMHRQGGGEAIVGTTWLLGIAAVVSIFVYYGFDGKASFHTVVRTLQVLWAGFISAYAILFFARYKYACAIEARWQEHCISSYKQSIPEFAIARAVAVKRALPEAWLGIEELDVKIYDMETEEYVPPPRPDPFLVLHYKNVKLYLDVWDEPRFEGRRTV